MTFAAGAMRFLLAALAHPAVQTVLNHALRVGTRELVRHVQHHTRSQKTVRHIS